MTKACEVRAIPSNGLARELRELNIAELRNCRVALMGRLEHCRMIASWLREHGVSAGAVLDNDPGKQGMETNGMTVMPPESFPDENREKDRIVIYSPKYWEDMSEQLISLGYEDRRQIIVLDRPGLQKNLAAVRKGAAVYRRFQKKYGADATVFLANCPLGDFYLLGLFFRDYCKREGIENYVMTGTSAGIGKLSDWLGIAPAERISEEESGALIRAWMFSGGRIRMKPLTLWQGAFRFNPCAVRQLPPLTFTDTFRSMIFGLPPETAPRFPKRERREAEMRRFFEKHALKPGRTVLLAPYSYSLPTMEESFWAVLAARLRGDGYTLAVNTDPKRGEKTVAGALPLTLDFQRTMDFMECAGTVIGMRSGFFDVTSQAECKRIVLYPKTKDGVTAWNPTGIAFTGLRRMGLCGDATEIETINLEQILEAIMKCVDWGR